MSRPHQSVEPSGRRWAALTSAAAYSGVPVRTLRKYIVDGILPAYRVGPRTLHVDLNDIDAMHTPVAAR